MSECEDGERSEAAAATAAEGEMETETPEEARWAAGGQDTGGGDGLSLNDRFPHSASEASRILRMERRVVEPVLRAASRLTPKGSELGGESFSPLREGSTLSDWRTKGMVGIFRTTPV